ncbi:MAG TPA: HRDC domain-containing protein [Thermoguttaceae bacterium]|nr:HRDC domain-containing protein [Thermoguttaceae bacterium]
MPHIEIKTPDALRDYCRRLDDSTFIGFDTEFVSEYSYHPVLCLVQVIDASGEVGLIDAMAVEDLEPLWEVIADDRREVVFHAGRSEMEFCHRAVGRLPANVFDVQLAAGLAGIEYPASYGSLISRVLGEKPNKHETRTDWRRRPLSSRQISYAVDDVRHLRPLRDELAGRLDALGRREWLREEMAAWLKHIEHAATAENWRRVSGNSGLDRRSLAVLRELWRWRETEAARRDKPVRHVLRDDLLVELARRKTDDPKRIRSVRGLERGDLQRQLGELAGHIRRAIELPEDECPATSEPQNIPQLAVLGQFLFAALGSVCREASLAPALVGTPNGVRELISHRLYNRPAHPPALARGWRAEVVGNLFEDLLAGKKSIRITDPASDCPLAFDAIQ